MYKKRLLGKKVEKLAYFFVLMTFEVAFHGDDGAGCR